MLVNITKVLENLALKNPEIMWEIIEGDNQF